MNDHRESHTLSVADVIQRFGADPATKPLAGILQRGVDGDLSLLPDDAELERRRQAAADEKWHDDCVKWGIPRKLAAATFAAARDTDAMRRVREYVTSQQQLGRCLVLAGPTGIGKSWAAIAALRLWPRHRWFFYVPRLTSLLLDPVQRPDALRQAARAEFLVLDDLGTEYRKEGGGMLESLIDEIFWAREGAELPTIITTNLTPGEHGTMRRYLSSRILDRINGPWGGVYEPTGCSLRVEGE